MSRRQSQRGGDQGAAGSSRREDRVMSSSPDPVTLVLQYEEDERMARELQEGGTPSRQSPVRQESHRDVSSALPRRLQEEFGNVDLLSESCLMDIRGQIGDMQGRLREEWIQHHERLEEEEEDVEDEEEEEEEEHLDEEELDEDEENMEVEAEPNIAPIIQEEFRNVGDLLSQSRLGAIRGQIGAMQGRRREEWIRHHERLEEEEEDEDEEDEEDDDEEEDEEDVEEEEVPITASNIQELFANVPRGMLCLFRVADSRGRLRRVSSLIDEEREDEDDGTDEDDSETDDEEGEADDENDEEELEEELQDEMHESPGGLYSSAINRLPTRVHSGDGPSTVPQSDARTCRVCIEGYADGDRLRILPCFHEFHALCIDPWLMRTSTCPVCRSKVDVSRS